jgi:hypothetical protein
MVIGKGAKVLLLGAEDRLIFPLTLTLSPIGGEGKK